MYTVCTYIYISYLLPLTVFFSAFFGLDQSFKVQWCARVAQMLDHCCEDFSGCWCVQTNKAQNANMSSVFGAEPIDMDQNRLNILESILTFWARLVKSFQPSFPRLLYSMKSTELVWDKTYHKPQPFGISHLDFLPICPPKWTKVPLGKGWWSCVFSMP